MRCKMGLPWCSLSLKGDEMTSHPLIASPPWTAEEEKQLRGLAKSGARPATIAKLLKRTEQAVRHRFYKLGAPLKRTDFGLREPRWRVGNGAEDLRVRACITVALICVI
jgi:Myb-like DNA-binding domain